MNLLGVDFGLKKIGIALAQNGFVQALGVIKNSSTVFSKIVKICQENEVEKIIVGSPQGKLFLEVKMFSQKLSSETGLPVEFQDETLTSREAIAKMVQERIKRKKRRKLEDAVAAACILEEYLLRKEGESV